MISSVLPFENTFLALLILIYIPTIFTIGTRTLNSLVSFYVIQSTAMCLLILLIYSENRSLILLFVAILTAVGKVMIIPFVMRRVIRRLKLKRDVKFQYFSPTTSLFASLFLSAISYMLITNLSPYLEFSTTSKFGAILGISLCQIGMLIMITRKLATTNIIGYLTMENGILVTAIAITELPFLIEIFGVLDLIMLIFLVMILVMRIDAGIETVERTLEIF